MRSLKKIAVNLTRSLTASFSLLKFALILINTGNIKEIKEAVGVSIFLPLVL